MAKLEALARRRRAVLRLSVHESASEVNRSGGEAQVVSCHRHLVFHPFVEQLIVFHTSGLVLASSLIGASLSEPHTSVTALRTHVCMLAYLLGPTTYRNF